MKRHLASFIAKLGIVVEFGIKGRSIRSIHSLTKIDRVLNNTKKTGNVSVKYLLLFFPVVSRPIKQPDEYIQFLFVVKPWPVCAEDNVVRAMDFEQTEKILLGQGMRGIGCVEIEVL
jgi:hypothetical protein